MGEYTAQAEVDNHFVTVTTPSSQTEWFDPMKDELFTTPCFSGHPSKEECIRKMLASAPGWDPVASPTIQPAAVEGLQHHHDKTAQHLPQPLTETTMGAIKTLVEQGNKPRNKKKSRVTPMPATAAMAQEA
ncbi:unnamed protein product [Urochloa humidicola]